MGSSKILPRRLSFSKICDILVAYLNAGADEEYVGVSGVAEKCDITLYNISRNNGFLKSWGFIEESDKEQGKYRLTREAAEFASAYRIDPDGDATRQILRSLLSKDEVLLRFVERMKNEGMNRESILVELPRVVGDLKADKVGLNAFLDLIAYAFKLDWLYAPAKVAKPAKRAAPIEAKAIKRVMKKVEEKPLKTITAIEAAAGPMANITINLTLTPDITPGMLKEYIKAMLKAYDEYAQERAGVDNRDN